MVVIGTLLDELGVVALFPAPVRFQIINKETTFLHEILIQAKINGRTFCTASCVYLEPHNIKTPCA